MGTHLCQLVGRLERSKVDALKDLLVQLLRLGRVKGQAQQDERVRQTLQRQGEACQGLLFINLQSLTEGIGQDRAI